MLHKGALVATLLGTLLRIQDYKKVKTPGRDISSLAAKGYSRKGAKNRVVYHRVEHLQQGHAGHVLVPSL